MKYGLHSNHLFKRLARTWRLKITSAPKFYKKQCLPVITWNKNIHESKLY